MGIEEIFNRKDMTFQEAVNHFQSRVPVTASQFYRIASQYRSLAFTVSGYTKAQILKRFYEEILTALEEGNTLQDFRTNMNNFLEAEGYEGLTPFQADNVFRTNIQTSYNVGHYEQMTDPDVLELRPYWQYDAVEDSHTRKSHLAMDGKVFPANSPVWDTWFPPNGFRCRCTVRTLSARQVKERGLKVEDGIPDAVELPTGDVIRSPMPDPRFRTNPAKAQFEPDLEGFPEPLAKAYRTQMEKGPKSP